MSHYPAISHTFFLHEVLGLRELGLEIETVSINLPDRTADAMPANEAAEAASTFFIKRTSPLRALLIAVATLLRHPRAFLRGLGFSLSLQSPSPLQLLYGVFYFVEALVLADWMRRRKLQHLHIHFSGAVATVGMVAAYAFRFPYSLTVHGPDDFFNERQFSLKDKIERASFVICISHYCRSQLMRIASPEHWDTMSVVRLGIRPELFPSRPAKRRGDPLRIVTVGRLVPAKGQLLLLRALLQLRSRGSIVNLLLVGDGPDRPHLEAFVRTHALEQQVTFAGARNHDEALEVLSTADMCVLASFAEGIPVALMEAMAMGIPCISTFTAGIPELLHHEEEGLLVPAGSVDDLASAIETLSANEELRQRFSMLGRARVLKDYNLATNLQLLASTFAERLANPVPLQSDPQRGIEAALQENYG
jgi:colanic acid/amylovoran biosynthesis glycosyltransferase